MDAVISLSDVPSLLRKLGSWEKVEELCGEKAVNLAKIIGTNINIADGFIITDAAYQKYVKNNNTIPDSLWEEILKHLHSLESRVAKFFGQKRPLFLTATGPSPLPGIDGIGMNDFTANELATASTLRDLPYQLYPRLIASLSSLAYGIDRDEFSFIFDQLLDYTGSIHVTNFKAYDWIHLTKIYKSIVIRKTGKMFPQNALDQLKIAIEAIFKAYTTLETKFSSGFSIFIQQHVFGDYDEKSFSALLTNYDFESGKKATSGYFCAKSSLDDIENGYRPLSPGAEADPAAAEIVSKIEQRIEIPFVAGVVNRSNKIFVTHIHTAIFGDERPFNIVKEAIEAGRPAKEAINLISAISAINANRNQLVEAPSEALAQGAEGSLGAASGPIVFTNAKCIEKSKNGEQVILVKSTITGADIEAVNAATGVISLHGAEFSNGAFLARTLGKPGVFGIEGSIIDHTNNSLMISDITIKEGEIVTIAGGFLYQGAVPIKEKNPEGIVLEIIKKADEIRNGKFEVLAACTNASQVSRSMENGADDIGILCMDAVVLDHAKDLIVKLVDNQEDEDVKAEIIKSITPPLTESLKSLPSDKNATIRLLSLALGSFLPSLKILTEEIAKLRVMKEQNKDFDEEKAKQLEENERLIEKTRKHNESNPLMGTRGARMLLTCKPLLEVLITAACQAAKAAGRNSLKFLVPLVTESREVSKIKERISEIVKKEGIENIEIGASLECARACLTSDSISQEADFIYIDAEGLTQTLFGMCKEDATYSFLNEYNSWNILQTSPFKTLDLDGAGDIIRKSVEKSKKKVIVCGSQIMCPASIKFLCDVGVCGICCTCEHLPLARLASGQFSKSE